jgi:hypothetical protein
MPNVFTDIASPKRTHIFSSENFRSARRDSKRIGFIGKTSSEHIPQATSRDVCVVASPLAPAVGAADVAAAPDMAAPEITVPDAGVNWRPPVATMTVLTRSEAVLSEPASSASEIFWPAARKTATCADTSSMLAER